VRRDRLRRVEQLEAAKLAKAAQCTVVGILYVKKASGMDRALTENERRVEDWHVDPDGHIREVRLRITADPSDYGRIYLRDEIGNETEDPRLEREISRFGRIISVGTKAGEKPLWKGRLGCRVLNYAS
jgi:hypothetical protein